MDRPALAILAAGLVAAVILYVPTLTGPFLCDDFWYLDQCLTEGSAPHPLPAALRKGNFYYFRPLPSLAWSVQFRLFGADPFGYRLVSLILHLGAATALFALGRRALRHDLAAALVALLFAIHPLHAEAVVWVSSSADLFAALFLALGLERWLAWRDGARDGRGGSLPFASLGFCLLALLSKESAYVFAPLLVAAELLPGATRPRRQRLTALAAFVGLTVAMFAVKFAVSMGQLRPPTGASPPGEWGKNFGEFIAAFLAGAPEASSNLRWGNLALVLLPLVLAAAPVIRPTRPWRQYLKFGLVFWALALLPPATVAGLGPGLFFSRVLYLPSMGLCLALGAALAAMGAGDYRWTSKSRKRRLMLVPAGILALALPMFFFFSASVNLRPWLRAAAAERDLAAKFAGLAGPVPVEGAVLVKGVPPILGGVPFHPNSYFLSVDCSLALYPSETINRKPGPASLPCYAVSAEAPAIEARGLPLKRLRELKLEPESAFQNVLLWSPPAP